VQYPSFKHRKGSFVCFYGFAHVELNRQGEKIMPNGGPELTDRGNLQVGLFAESVGRPVGNARISITPKGEPANIIDELITDSNGQSPSVILPAPPLDFSMEPSEQPYSEYDLNITADGFAPFRIEGVQVFPDATALQNTTLNPLTEYGQYSVISIQPNTLWGIFPPKIPEDEVKPLPPGRGLVVLPDPVVPEFVVVHAGAPSNASAPNYWVPFKDYIKNVGSSEIYATWPESTIRANIVAIISFTLNRVYTEWYRGKGYNFTITNSTAYDHAFTYGRNIFDEISRVVDEIFTTFITRPNIRQPLLAQYCDGRRVSCPNWLSQWGSKALGDSGYVTIDILKNYYGSDIFLMQATKVEGVPISFPGTTLQTGSTGQPVRVIQEQLNAISNNYPLIKKLRVDGIFGANTREAVETFQKTFDLPTSGIVDYATWYRISNIYVAVTRMAELV